MELGIAGKVALVTASSKGLGRASAEALLLEGANVVISARGEETLGETERALAGIGGEVHAIAADVTDPESAELVAATVERFGGLDILVPNAAVRRQDGPWK